MEQPRRANPIQFAIGVGGVVLLAVAGLLINRYWLPMPPRATEGWSFPGLGFVTGVHVLLYLFVFLAAVIWLFRQSDELEARLKLIIPLFFASLALLVSFNSFNFGSPHNWPPESFMPLFFFLMGWMSLKKRLANRNSSRANDPGAPTDEAQQIR